MQTLPIALAIAATALVCAAIAWFFTRQERVRRALKAPIVPIAKVRAGQMVRVTGTLVLGDGSLEAPLSHRTCAHFDAVVEEQFGDAWRDTWHTIAHETSSRPFFIEDATGKIEIDTTRFEGIIVRDHHKAKGDLDLEQARVFLNRHGRQTEIVPDRVLRYREGVLEAGEIVTVMGRVRREDRGGAEHLVIGDGQELVRASDDPELVR